MSQNVARLKELLFDDEARLLAELTRRLEASAKADAEARTELGRQLTEFADVDRAGREALRVAIDDVISRAVTSDRLSDSVAEVMSDAMRKAEVAQHHELSQSIAPLVVTTIKTELRNSQDEMVEALYPLTGRLVKSYVASAMKDLADQMNRSIEQSSLMLRLRSLTTGKSVAELALAGAQDFGIEDLLLIRRGSGDLIARWPEKASVGRDQAMSGVLAAINEFADDALSAELGQLRQIDLGEQVVYLRGSPKYLLAARCAGAAPPSIERLIDDAFLDAIERQHNVEPMADAAASRSALTAAARDLEVKLMAEKAALKSPGGGGALKTLAVLILAPLVLWIGSLWYDAFESSRTRDVAIRTVDATPGMRGYPVAYDVGPYGATLAVSGITPSENARFDTLHRLRRALPRVAVLDRLTVVAGAGVTQAPDLSNDVAALRARDDERRLADAAAGVRRTETLLATTVADLSRAAARARTNERSDEFKAIGARIGEIQRDVQSLKSALAQATTLDRADAVIASATAVTLSLAPLATEIEVAALPAEAPAALAIDAPAPPSANTMRDAIDALTATAEQMAIRAAAAPLAVALEPKPLPPPPPAYAPSPREKLEAAARATAIFFENGVDYVNAKAVADALKALAPLVREANVALRVIGYTDEAGGDTINSPLAQQRADRVRSELLANGAPANLVVAVGRSDRLDISTAAGPGNPNRRVEFQVGFDGEPRP